MFVIIIAISVPGCSVNRQTKNSSVCSSWSAHWGRHCSALP